MASPFRSSRVPAAGGVFLMMDDAKAEARASGLEVFGLDVGASDLPPPPEAIETLIQSVSDPTTHSYCLKRATMPLLEAATDWYRSQYGLQLDPQHEALMLIGSQEGLGHLLLSAADHGDGILMCDVAYPSYFGAVHVAGLKPIFMALDGNGLPNLDLIDTKELKGKQAKIMLLNYPNNPTAATADEAFFTQAIAFCKGNNLLLIHDAPYADQTFDQDHAPSPLSLPGGRDCVIEIFSFSKSYHLAGFRLGFALGNACAIAALESVKAPIDFNQYLGIQRMGITCLGLPRERVRRNASIWKGRAAAMVGALRAAGVEDVKMPNSCMYIWLRLPHPLDDLEFCMEGVKRTGVAVTPGRAFGPGGKGHIRIALVQPESVLQKAAIAIAQTMREMLAEAASSGGGTEQR